MKQTILLLLLIVFTACESAKTKQQSEKVENSEVTPLDTLTSKDLSLKIYFEKSKVIHSDSLNVTLELKNTSSKTGKVLFDKPEPSTGGFIHSGVSIFDLTTKKSVVKYGNKYLLSLQLIEQEEYKNAYYTLKPNQVIKRTYPLNFFVIYNTDDNQLPKGKYNCSFWLERLESNEVLFEIY